MAKVKGKIKVDDNTLKELREFANNFITSDLNDKLRKNIRRLKSAIQKLVRNKLFNSKAFQSIRNGELNQLFEIDNADEVLDKIIESISKNIEVTISKIKRKGLNQSTIVVSIQREDFSDIADLVPDTNNFSVRFNWLQELLFGGNDVSIFNFGILFEKEVDTIGKAIEDINRDFEAKMTAKVYIKKRPFNLHLPPKARGIIEIPEEYRGTHQNNFITRALAGIEEDVASLINRYLFGTITGSSVDILNISTEGRLVDKERSEIIGGE
jgi:hypothetical protein